MILKKQKNWWFFKTSAWPGTRNDNCYSFILFVPTYETKVFEITACTKDVLKLFNLMTNYRSRISVFLFQIKKKKITAWKIKRKKVWQLQKYSSTCLQVFENWLLFKRRNAPDILLLIVFSNVYKFFSIV